MIENFNLQMEDSYGLADNVLCSAEDPDEEDSLWDCYYYFENLTFDDVDWDYLELLGEENEVYCLVYNHENQIRRGFWYDEDAEWVDQKTGVIEEYEALKK